jgi:hypothetical protein
MKDIILGYKSVRNVHLSVKLVITLLLIAPVVIRLAFYQNYRKNLTVHYLHVKQYVQIVILVISRIFANHVKYILNKLNIMDINI